MFDYTYKVKLDNRNTSVIFFAILIVYIAIPNPKEQINLFLLLALITYGPGIYVPNMGINCCSLHKARVFHGLHEYIDGDFCRIKKD